MSPAVCVTGKAYNGGSARSAGPPLRVFAAFGVTGLGRPLHPPVSRWLGMRPHERPFQMGHDQAQEGRAWTRRAVRLWTKLIREIVTAARIGGGDIDGNPRLRKAVADARGQQMPADNIKRAIQRGTGELEGASYEEVLYEGTGPQGTLFLVEGMTDNRNRAAAELRKIFERHNGQMGGSGTAGWAFDRQGVITLEKSKVTEDQLMEAAVEAGADDYRDEGEIWTVYTPATDLDRVSDRARRREARAAVEQGWPTSRRTRRWSRAVRPRSASTSSRRSTSTRTCRTSSPTSTSPKKSSPASRATRK